MSLKSPSYMEMCIHSDGKDPIYLRIPTFWDSIKEQWIGCIQTPKTEKLIHATGLDSFELQNNFNIAIGSLFEEGGDIADEIFSMFKPLKEWQDEDK